MYLSQNRLNCEKNYWYRWESCNLSVGCILKWTKQCLVEKKTVVVLKRNNIKILIIFSRILNNTPTQ